MSKKQSENGLAYGRGYVYAMQYHIVFCTKYRKQVLTDEIADDLKTLLQGIAEEYDFKILALEVMPDHVHILVDCKPQFNPTDMIKIIKGNTARLLFIKHPSLKQYLYKGHLWNPSYCITTVSDRTTDIVREYVESQKTRD